MARERGAESLARMNISMMVGGAPHYEVGLISALAQRDVILDVLGTTELKSLPAMQLPQVTYKDIQGSSGRRPSLLLKIIKVFWVYARLFGYAAKSNCKLIHIQWPYKIVLFDRTFLLAYYKLLGKKVV